MDNTAMAERSLLYFDDAQDMSNRDNQVVILNGANWNDVKQHITDSYQQFRNQRGKNRGQGMSM